MRTVFQQSPRDANEAMQAGHPAQPPSAPSPTAIPDAPPAVMLQGIGKRYGMADMARGTTLYDRFASLLGHQPPIPVRDDTFWALRDITLDVPRGSILGVVGRNGSGKTTLMKILARITTPTVGRAALRGRVGALLEIGSGFHPELSGRENIRFTGAIMGMTPTEADDAMDAIVAFADIGRFLDVPVKFYSIGMYMRLAFAVSAHLSNEILLLDEILAVGDETFQQKCRDRMRELCASDRTVLIISHVSDLLRTLCDRLLVLEAGRIAWLGDPRDGLDYYHREILARPPGAIFEGETPHVGAVPGAT